MKFSPSSIIYIILITYILSTVAFANTELWDENNIFIPSKNLTKKVSSNITIAKQSINITGSTTVSNVLHLLADNFEQEYKVTRINISGGGSSNAVKAMIKNKDVIGQMSRAMKKHEKNTFIKKYGYKPIEFKIAVDALAIYVNKNNPIDKLTMKQLSNVFSDSHQQMNYWGDLKLVKLDAGDWKKQIIQIFTLPKFSGAYSLFNKKILNNAGYKISSKSKPTSSSVVQSVGVNIGAISFASSFFKTKRTHFVKIQGKDGSYYSPTQPYISNFKYPMSRYLYLYLNQKPGTKMSTQNKQFLQFLMDKGTQALIKRSGFYSIAEDIRQRQIKLLDKY